MSEGESKPRGSERAALDRIGWHLEDAFSRDAVPTVRRGHNLVVISPPSAVYAAPALAALAARDQVAGPPTLVLSHPSMVHELAWALECMASPAGSPCLAIPEGSRVTLSNDAPASVLVTTPRHVLDLLSHSLLRPNHLQTVLLAWPECWESDLGLQDLMADVPGGVQRLIYTAAPERARGLIERYAWRALTVGMPGEVPVAAVPRAVRTVSVPWHRRGEALRGALAVLDPGRCAVWTATAVAAHEARLALAGAMTGVTVFHDEPPEAELLIAFDLPTPHRLWGWQTSSMCVLLVPPVAAGYAASLGLTDRALRLPGALEAARDQAAARRRAVADVIDGTSLDGTILALAPLFDRFEPVQVAGALYQLWSDAPAAQPAAVASPHPTVRMFVSAGKKDGVTVAELVAILAKEIGVERSAIGRIDLRETHALVELPARDADRIIAAMNGKRLRRKRVTARLDRAPARAR